VFAVPGDLATPTGGYAYDARIIKELRLAGWQVDVVNLGDGFPFPSMERRRSAEAKLSAIPAGRPVVVDGLALGVLPETGARLGPDRPLIALVHHPLAREAGLTAAEIKAFHASEQAALAGSARVVVTSESTARLLVADFAVPAERITVARPGADPVPPSQGSRDGIVRLLSIGSVVPGKGYDVLVAAMASLTDLPWRLAIAGDRTRNLPTAARLDADIAGYGLCDRVAVLGAVSRERIAELYMESDLFVLASRFEGYGMAIAEAIAHGLPVVSTTAGAIPDTVPAGTGILVPPDDPAALASAIRRLVEGPRERRRLADAARLAAAQLPAWRDSGRLFAGAIEAVT
jgi:glycosyltransferase involved in cell wall biosynthesis